MDVKRITKESTDFADIYSKALSWWDFWKFPAPPIEFLPINMICAYNDKEPVCIGFLYITDSKISWLEFIVANPKVSKQDRSNGIENVLSSARILADALGYKAIFTTSKNQSLNSKLEKKFQKTDVGVTHFIERI